MAVSGVVGRNSSAGGVIDLSTGSFTEDSNAQEWGSLDVTANQWVPAPASLIAPDGKSFASSTLRAITRTNLTSGVTHEIVPYSASTTGAQNYSTDVEPVAYTKDGIYFNASGDDTGSSDFTTSTFDLMVVNPATGDYHVVAQHPPGDASLVVGGSAYAPGNPLAETDDGTTIWKINITTGSATKFFHQAGLFVNLTAALPDGTIFAYVSPNGGDSNSLAVITPDAKLHVLGSADRSNVPEAASPQAVVIDNGVAWTMLPRSGDGLEISRYENGTLHRVGTIPETLQAQGGSMWVGSIESGCGATITKVQAAPSPQPSPGGYGRGSLVGCSAMPLSWNAPQARGCPG